MKLRRATLVSAALLLGMVMASDVLAGRGGSRSGGHGAGHRAGHSAGVGAHPRHFAGTGRFAPGFRSTVIVGAPLFASTYFYPPPPYYYPGSLVVPPAPAYIEQSPGQIDPQQSQYWYFCASSNAYYPYAQTCPEGWRQVLPQPLS